MFAHTRSSLLEQSRSFSCNIFHILDLANCFFLIRIRSNILSQNLVSNIVYFSLYHIPRTKCEIVSLLVIQSLAPWLRTTRSLHSKGTFVNTNLWGVGGLFGASSKFHQLSVKGVTCFKYQKFGPWHMTTGQVPPGSDSQAHVFPMGIG